MTAGGSSTRNSHFGLTALVWRHRSVMRFIHTLAISFAAASIAGCFLIPEENEQLAPPLVEAPEVTYDVIELQPRNLLKKVSMSGRLVPVTEERLFFRYRGGRLVNLHVSYGDTMREGQLIAELSGGDLEDQAELREIGVAKARLQLERLRSLGASQIEVELAELSVREAEIQLRMVLRQREDSRLVSPISGPVVYIGAKEGEYVEPFQVIATVVDPTNMVLECSADKAGDFPRGTEVQVDFGGADRTGTVIANPLDNPDPEYRINERQDRIIVRVDDLPPGARMNDAAVVSLVLARRENTLVVPRYLLKTHAGRTYVNVLKDGLKEERDVETGVVTANEVEIVAGLSPGDLLIAR